MLALNSKGDSLWQKIYSPNPQYPQGFFFNIFNRIKETRENDFILVGTKGITSITGSSYIKVSKINALGDIVWEHIQSIKPGINEGKDFLFDNDQNIVVVGTAGATDYLEPERQKQYAFCNQHHIQKQHLPACILLGNSYIPVVFSLPVVV